MQPFVSSRHTQVFNLAVAAAVNTAVCVANTTGSNQRSIIGAYVCKTAVFYELYVCGICMFSIEQP